MSSATMDDVCRKRPRGREAETTGEPKTLVDLPVVHVFAKRRNWSTSLVTRVGGTNQSHLLGIKLAASACSPHHAPSSRRN